MKKQILFCLVLFHVSTSLFCGTWSKKASVPTTARYLPAGFSIGTKGYVGCGMKGTTSNMFNDFWEWDQASNTWTQKANFAGTQRQCPIGFSIGAKGYMGGGADISGNQSDFYEYDPATNVWTAKTNIPSVNTYCSVAFSIGTKGYVGTGSNGTGTSTDFNEYDPATDTWTAKAIFGGLGRMGGVGFSVGTKGYIGLGILSIGSAKDLWEWDQAGNTWTQKANFPPGTRTFASAFTIGNMGYVGTGLDSTGKGNNDLWQFDPVANSWTAMPSFAGSVRYGATAFSIGCSGYFTLGLDLATVVYQNDLWQYTTCALPKALFSANDTNVCAGTTINFTDKSTNSPLTWSWTFAGGTPSSSTVENPSVMYNTGGTYPVKLTVTNPAGNNTEDSIGYINIVSHTIPNAGNDTTICIGSSVKLAASGGTSYAWNPSASLSDTAIFNPVATPTVTTPYIVSVGNSPCPSGTDTVVVKVDSLPVAHAGLPIAICKGSTTTLSGTGGVPYSWSPAASLSCSNCSNPLASPDSTTTYRLTVGAGGCTAKDSVVITVNPVPKVIAGNDTTLSQVTTITLTASGTGISYSWSPSTDLSCSTCASTSATPAVTTTYTVIATDANGCTAIDSVTINVDVKCGSVFVPTAFSPNGDNQNDFECVRGNCISELDFLIYDRWGELMFESRDAKQCWDGKYHGKLMDPAVFMYYMKATLETGQVVIQKGNITLVR